MSKLRQPLSPRDHIAGDANAPLILVEYGDYQCPHCGMAHPVVHRLQRDFGPRLAFVFRHFPLTEIHPIAGAAAEAAEFAGAHGRFWEMHDALFVNQHRLSIPALYVLASELGLSQVELRDAIALHRYLPKVQEDFIGGVRSGVNGTPTFFINGERHDGTYLYQDLFAALTQHLANAVIEA